MWKKWTEKGDTEGKLCAAVQLCHRATLPPLKSRQLCLGGGWEGGGCCEYGVEVFACTRGKVTVTELASFLHFLLHVRGVCLAAEKQKSTCSFLAVWATRWLLCTDRVLETLGQETKSSLYSLYKWLISFSVCSCFIISKLCHGLLMSHV